MRGVLGRSQTRRSPPLGPRLARRGPRRCSGPLTLVQLGVGGQAAVLLLACLLRLVVIELVPAPAGLVRKHHTCGVADSLGRAGRRGKGKKRRGSLAERAGEMLSEEPWGPRIRPRPSPAGEEGLEPPGLTLQAQGQRHALVLDAVDEFTAVPALVLQAHARNDQRGV